MLGPMAVLGLACVFIGLMPAAIAPVLESATRAWATDVASVAAPIGVLAPLHLLTVTGLSLIALTGAGAALLAKRTGKVHTPSLPTSACLYPPPSPPIPPP